MFFSPEGLHADPKQDFDPSLAVYRLGKSRGAGRSRIGVPAFFGQWLHTCVTCTNILLGAGNGFGIETAQSLLTPWNLPS